MSTKFLILAAVVALANGHGYMKHPLARTSIHLSDEFNPVYNPPYWYDNSGVWCGNVPQDTRYSSCGRCGDRQGETGANQGGEFDKGVITATFTAGSVVDIVSDIGAAHYGHIEFELCPQSQETDSCFQKLPVVGGNQEVRDGNRICVNSGSTLNNLVAQVWLPAGVTCSRCTIRWTYRTSYTPHGPQYGRDFCDNPEPTQTFRNCADVKIV